MKTILLLMTIFATTGAVAYAAGESNPGDPLYSVKVNINENLESAVVFDTKTEARVQAENFAERLREVDELAAEGSVDTETESKLRTRITNQFEKAYELILKLEDDGGLEKAAVAREIMQNAMDAHMSDYQLVLPSISRDIDVYSKILTETLIEVSIREA